MTEARAAGESSLHSDLLASLGIALFHTDENGRWTFLSRAWTQITGYEVSESLDMPSRLYLHEADLLKSSRLIRSMQRNPGVLCRETLRARKADGTYCLVEVNARLEGGQHNQPVSAWGFLTEVYQRKPALRAPHGNAVAVQSAQLNAQASLTLIENALQSLSATALSEEQIRLVRMARSGADGLRALVHTTSPREGPLRTVPVRPMHILLVEDQPVTQKLVTLLLEKWGHSVRTASDGHAALDAFAKGKFDLVLMDLQMPVMDGLAATRAIRELEAREQRTPTPIVAMTAQNSDTDRDTCLENGMDDFVSKPVTASALERILARRTRPPRPGPQVPSTRNKNTK